MLNPIKSYSKMSAHFAHQHLRDRPNSHHSSPFQTPPPTLGIHHLDRPHSSGISSIATPIEMFFLFLAILALLALIVWLAWIAISHCIKFTREKMDDLDVGKQTRKNVKRTEEAPKKMFTLGIDMGRVTMAFFDGFMRGEREQGRRGREDERRALLRGNRYEERVMTGIPRGVYIQGYGYDRERYGDGTNDTSSPRSTSVSVDHRDDCDGQCGLTERRRSMDS
jgi:hypothetical protein